MNRIIESTGLIIDQVILKQTNSLNVISIRIMYVGWICVVIIVVIIIIIII